MPFAVGNYREREREDGEGEGGERERTINFRHLILFSFRSLSHIFIAQENLKREKSIIIATVTHVLLTHTHECYNQRLNI